MQAQAELYPSNIFLSEASSRIVAELVSARVECFRSLEAYLDFFVPIYSTPRGGINSEQVTVLRAWLKVEFPNNAKSQFAVNHFLSAGVSAVAEYSVFQAADGFDSEVLLLRNKGQSAV
jgi:hypothetical protein